MLRYSFQRASVTASNLVKSWRIITFFRLKPIAYFCTEIIHKDLATHICISELSHHWFRLKLETRTTTPSHYFNQWWLIVNFTYNTNLREVLIKLQTFASPEMSFKIRSAKGWLFCSDHNVLKHTTTLFQLSFTLAVPYVHYILEWLWISNKMAFVAAVSVQIDVESYL